MADANKSANDRLALGAADRPKTVDVSVDGDVLAIGARDVGAARRIGPPEGIGFRLVERGSVKVLTADTTPPIKMQRLILMGKGWA